MRTWGIRHLPGLRLALAIVLGHVVIGPGRADAQGVFRATPSFSLTQLHDDNLFSTPSEPESDLITRMSPGIDSEYRSGLLTLSGRYLLDIEHFADHPALTTMDARQQAAIALAYHPTRRMAWATGAELLKTRTPGELNAETGLTFARAEAQRVSAHSSVSRQLTPLTSGTIDYAFSQDHLAGQFEGHTQSATAGASHRRSPREKVSLDYRFHQFVFGRPGAASTSAAISHAVVVGWSRAITRRLNITIDGGPRVTNSVPAAELSASIQYQRTPGDLSLVYSRTQATVIGIAGTADVQSLTAHAGWTVGRSLQMRVSPGVFHSALGGLRADVYVLSADVARPIAPGLSIGVAVDGALQHGSLLPNLALQTIARRAVLIRLVASPVSRVH